MRYKYTKYVPNLMDELDIDDLMSKLSAAPVSGDGPALPPPEGPAGAFPPPGPRRRVAKYLLLGALLGVVATIVLPLALARLDSALGGSGLLFLLGFVVVILLAIGLTVAPRTRLLGAGVFIGFGVALVVGAGVCVALLASLGTV